MSGNRSYIDAFILIIIAALFFWALLAIFFIACASNIRITR